MEKQRLVRTWSILSKCCFYSKFIPNIQIFKDAPLIAIHFWSGWWADASGVLNPLARHILRNDWDMKYNCTIFCPHFTKISIYLLRKGISEWFQLRHKIKRGPSESVPKCIQIWQHPRSIPKRYKSHCIYAHFFTNLAFFV